MFRILVADIEDGVSGASDSPPAHRAALGGAAPRRTLVVGPLRTCATGRWPGIAPLRARAANRRTRFRRLVAPTTNPALVLLASSVRRPISGVRLLTPRVAGMATAAVRIGHHRELIGFVVHLAVQFHITVLWGS
ncbi:hypothetical protein GCM10027089_39420 [Nocardia thraciensis]